MNICVLSPSYPTTKTIDFVFVDQLCQALADLGHEVVVIAPQSITKCFFRHIPLCQTHSWYNTKNGAQIELYRPYSITLSTSIFAKLCKHSFQHAVNRAFRRLKQKPNVCYGHFWQSIFTLFPIARKNNIPLFGASGEEDVAFYIHKSEEYINEVREYISGVISVSQKNQLECLNLHLVDKEKSIVIPNAIDQSLFYKRDKAEFCKRFGIKDDDFVVIFVGQFVSRKGTMRLNAALKQLNDSHIKAIFIGSGNENPDYDRIIHKGYVSHDDLPNWLNVADVFVLPTENEGCSNAIIEAMACGLPIISTDAPFNHDILNENNSILINCHDIDGIAASILRLKNEQKLWQQLSAGALATAKELSINRRAERIIEFMQNKIQK